MQPMDILDADPKSQDKCTSEIAKYLLCFSQAAYRMGRASPTEGSSLSTKVYARSLGTGANTVMEFNILHGHHHFRVRLISGLNRLRHTPIGVIGKLCDSTSQVLAWRSTAA